MYKDVNLPKSIVSARISCSYLDRVLLLVTWRWHCLTTRGNLADYVCSCGLRMTSSYKMNFQLEDHYFGNGRKFEIGKVVRG